jgi:hypothetical protein
MEYISAEEFLKQPKEIQKVFLDWWKPQMYDLFFRNFTNENGFLKGIYKGCIEDNEVLKSANKDNSFMPLITEGQLRKFIEDRTECKLDIEYFSTDSVLFRFRIGRKEKKSHMFYDTKSLIQAYWKVALEIAKECITNE